MRTCKRLTRASAVSSGRCIRASPVSSSFMFSALGVAPAGSDFGGANFTWYLQAYTFHIQIGLRRILSDAEM